MFNAADMFRLFQKHRGNAVVIPGRGTPHWQSISTNPSRDILLGPPPAMGGYASFAFGLALAQPKEKVVMFDSEGDLLMNLGALATIADLKPRNFYHFIMDNECYAATGGQPIPNSTAISYSGIAREAGYPSAYFFDDLEELADKIAMILSQPGPVLIHMKIVPEIRPPGRQRTEEASVVDDLQVLRDIKKTLGVAVR